MSTGHTLLLGTDLGASGPSALEVTTMLARDLGLGVVLVHAHGGLPAVDPRIDPATKPIADKMVERLREERAALEQQLAAERALLESRGVKVSSARVVEGPASEVLVREAAGLSARVVVVGPHGKDRPVLDRFLGSTAEHVLRKASCPVVVAPRVSGPGPALRGGVIVVGIDDEPPSLEALAVALELAVDASASVEAIHAGDDSHVVDHAVAWVRAHTGPARLDAALAGVRRVAAAPSIPSAVVEAAKRNHAALVVLGTHGRRGVSRMVLGSVAESVCRESPVPVLVVRARR